MQSFFALTVDLSISILQLLQFPTTYTLTIFSIYFRAPVGYAAAVKLQCFWPMVYINGDNDVRVDAAILCVYTVLCKLDK